MSQLGDRRIQQQIFKFASRPWVIIMVLLVLLLGIAIPLSIRFFASRQTAGPNPIQIENQRQGTTDWKLTNPAQFDSRTYHYPSIEGYAWATSAEADDQVGFSVSTNASFYTADVYRMGWYQGKGGRLLQSMRDIPGHSYLVPQMEKRTGLIEATWPLSFTLKIAPEWVSGVYLIKLTAANGPQAYIPFVVRSSRLSDLAFIHAVNTDEAYNYWGGTSLYTDLTHTLRAQRAFSVSFDRPFEHSTGAGQFFWWEYPMVRWLEKNGYDVSYFSDLDLQDRVSLLQTHRVLLIVGHSEYWSKKMRDNLETIISKRVNLAVFAANTAYVQIRYEPRSADTNPLPERVIVCYKEKADDPLYGKDNSLVTVKFRDDLLSRPEQVILGSMYASWWNSDQGGFPWVVSNASSWVYAGTSLKNNDSLPGLIGNEYDKVFSNYPIAPGLQILSTSPVVDIYKHKDVANGTLYNAASGARVFNAGTFQWSWGLDCSSPLNPRNLVNPAVEKITSNILQNFINE